MSNLSALNKDGYFIAPPLCPPDVLEEMKNILGTPPGDPNNAILTKNGETFGIRHALNLFPGIKPLLGPAGITSLMQKILGKNARIVRSIFFDKTPAANWNVAIHQDTTVAAKEKHEIEGFTTWTLKAGIPHVQPPEQFLQNMVTLRLHLDETTADNGALRVLPGSHNKGRMKMADILTLRQENTPVLCPVQAGGVMAMRPLLLHESGAGPNPARRRVLHLECSADKLPKPLEWYETA
ncbi:MAG: phytanoyl-CoA dioxygenase family protein [Alphaproteobacteria bacterium]|nr:phytanoyl-CoA dioxygenase family protein [Alphaproteobacteria bacterium]MCB9975712.1 phytanoyl-CoA dioxygenase family protein [Rhodospirillales bacterium]